MGFPVSFPGRVVALLSTRARGLWAALLLAGCSSASILAPEAPMQLELGPADYQTMVSKMLAQMPQRGSMELIEVSAPRKTRLSQPGDWMVCVRTLMKDRPTYIAMFIREGLIVDHRLAVIIDECMQAQYQPLQTP
jgi:hypothetical protein